MGSLVPVLSLRSAGLSFGPTPLVDDASLAIARGDKSCLVGPNGAGKSSLLKALAGLLDLDPGERFARPGVLVGYLPQETAAAGGTSVWDFVRSGAGRTVDAPRFERQAVALLERLGLDPGAQVATLSGGAVRRADLARALAGEPDVLLLDEPTNHLDIPTIEWLEETLLDFRGGLLVVSHDRAFLTRLTRRTFWLRLGRLLRLDAGFERFERWSEEVFAAEDAEARRRRQRLAAGRRWLERGVTARRRRNRGRLRRLTELREERARRAVAERRVRFIVDAVAPGGKLAVEARRIRKGFGDKIVFRDFSTRVLRGDRVGIIGPSGAGKTTLLRMLTGDLEPNFGTVRLGTGLRAAYFDQLRATLDEEATVIEILCGKGSDTVVVDGKQRHVVGYLRDFLFDEGRARSPAKSLSGGERSRLLLAKLFLRPSNLLALDEPTNDLDTDSLDVLLDVLGAYEGTLLVVSHDRDFLDRLVTSVIVLDGEGGAVEYAGGYSDYLRQRPASVAEAEAKPGPKRQAQRRRAGERPGRLRHRLGQELERLSARIEALEAEVAGLESRLTEPDFYGRDRQGFAAAAERLERARDELEAAADRWLDLAAAAEAGEAEARR